MKRTLAKMVGITISIILILQSSQVFAVTQKELQQKQQKAEQQTAENENKIDEAREKQEEIAN